MSTHTSDAWHDYDSSQYFDLIQAVEWYTTHCDSSSRYLTGRLESLKSAVHDTYFHYDTYKYTRFTVRYKLSGGLEKEEYNQLIRREFDGYYKVRKFEVGDIVRHNGMQLRVVEVFEKHIDKKYGNFIAESISVKEQLEMKKGGY